jgi:2,4-dienoyl-CoA reductase-like NADH-dependent reductase (Old Yellow Enzyme family)
MSLANLLKKGSLRQFATATVATVATVRSDRPPSVASVATVSVENPQNLAANDPELEPAADTNAWRELVEAYHAHHFSCTVCISAGRGAMYGQRCGVGAALWGIYG